MDNTQQNTEGHRHGTQQQLEYAIALAVEFVNNLYEDLQEFKSLIQGTSEACRHATSRIPKQPNHPQRGMREAHLHVLEQSRDALQARLDETLARYDDAVRCLKMLVAQRNRQMRAAS